MIDNSDQKQARKVVYTACSTCGDHSHNDSGQRCGKHDNPEPWRCPGTYLPID